MKKRLLVLFFTVHLLLILFQSIWATIDGYWSFHFNKKPYVPVFSWLKQNTRTELYYMLSGTNTGYGFYGIKTSTKKYLLITFLDSTGNIIKSGRYFHLSTSNGISRLGGYASYLANYIADSKKIADADTTGISSEIIEFRRNYITKILKWFGKEASAIAGSASYKIKLLTIVPENIWYRPRNNEPELYVIQEGIYPVR